MNLLNLTDTSSIEQTELEDSGIALPIPLVLSVDQIHPKMLKALDIAELSWLTPWLMKSGTVPMD